MNKQSWWVSLATLGFIGYMPPGRAAAASLLMLPLVWLLSLLPIFIAVSAVVILSGLSYFIIKKALPRFTTSDPRPIVLDDAMGCLWTFLGITLTWKTIFFGFIALRLIDDTKIAGLHYIEEIPGAWGILLDDIAAGILANAVLWGLIVWLGW